METIFFCTKTPSVLNSELSYLQRAVRAILPRKSKAATKATQPSQTNVRDVFALPIAISLEISINFATEPDKLPFLFSDLQLLWDLLRARSETFASDMLFLSLSDENMSSPIFPPD